MTDKTNRLEQLDSALFQPVTPTNYDIDMASLLRPAFNKNGDNFMPHGFAKSETLIAMMEKSQEKGREILGPHTDTTYTNKQLANMISPREPNSPFAPFQDLSALTVEADKIPEGRHNRGLYNNNETYWIEAINNRIAKVILTRTLW